MCGFVGRFVFGSAALGDLTPLLHATQSLAHRGPNDGRYWADERCFLGHRRLSVIDLATGAQPMASRSGHLIVVFNGEIYNYRELAQELAGRGAVFATQSDTEVILNGYLAWGADLLSRIEGMFAFALIDRRDGSVLLARDRLGEKPLFYSTAGGRLTFASQLGALADLPDQPFALDPLVLSEYLALNYVPGSTTLVRGIAKVRPGTAIRFDAQGRRTDVVYWRPSPDGDAGRLSAPEALAALRPRIDGSVALALRSDVPVTLFLSGGIDSSVVAESAARQGGLRTAYCLDFEDRRFSEWPQAARVAKQLGLELRRAVARPAALAEFLELVRRADDPLADSSALAQWALAKEVARDYRVALSGDGGDEVFAGYLTYQASLLHGRIAAAVPAGMRRVLAGLVRLLPNRPGKVSFSYRLGRFLRSLPLSPGPAHLAWNGAWPPAAIAGLLSPDFAAAAAPAAALDRVWSDRDEPDTGRLTLLALQQADLRQYLPNDILVKVDRMTMAHGLESRAPFLHPAVVNFGLGLSDALKVSPRGELKVLLRMHARELFGPAIADARKQGFSIPVHAWLRGEMRDVTEDLLSAESLANVPFLDPVAVRQYKDRHMRGAIQYGFELWGLMVLVAWYRQRIARHGTKPAGPMHLSRIDFDALASN